MPQDTERGLDASLHCFPPPAPFQQCGDAAPLFGSLHSDAAGAEQSCAPRFTDRKVWDDNLNPSSRLPEQALGVNLEDGVAYSPQIHQPQRKDTKSKWILLRFFTDKSIWSLMR